MSLQEAVLDIAKDMEEKIKGLSDDQGAGYLFAYAIALKAAVKAAGPPRMSEGPALVDREAEMLERLNMQRMRKEAQREEVDSSVMTEVVGGPAGDTWAPRPSQMPTGAKCSIAGATYHLGDDGKLYFLPPTTSG